MSDPRELYRQYVSPSDYSGEWVQREALHQQLVNIVPMRAPIGDRRSNTSDAAPQRCGVRFSRRAGTAATISTTWLRLGLHGIILHSLQPLYMSEFTSLHSCGSGLLFKKGTCVSGHQHLDC